MGSKSSSLTDGHVDFIKQQKLFFVATAASGGRINLSPKGLDSLRVLDPQRIAWLNLTGSGNETSGHVQSSARMTLMFCSFAGRPMILRVYGQAKVYHRLDEPWNELAGLFAPAIGARQIFDVAVDLVQVSCGFSVPLFAYTGDRDVLSKWEAKRGRQGIEQYWLEHNATTLDGAPTHIAQKNLGKEPA